MTSGHRQTSVAHLTASWRRGHCTENGQRERVLCCKSTTQMCHPSSSQCSVTSMRNKGTTIVNSLRYICSLPDSPPPYHTHFPVVYVLLQVLNSAASRPKQCSLSKFAQDKYRIQNSKNCQKLHCKIDWDDA